MSWWSSQPHSWDQDWHGSSWWQEGPDWTSNKKDKDKDKEKDRFKNVTSLGAASKHPLPLEDRKSLLVSLADELGPGRTPLSKIAIGQLNSTITHALLFLFCRATPRMSIRLLRDDANLFTISYAAKQLADTARSLHQPQAFANPWSLGPCVGSRWVQDLAQPHLVHIRVVQVRARFGSDLAQDLAQSLVRAVWFRLGSALGSALV